LALWLGGRDSHGVPVDALGQRGYQRQRAFERIPPAAMARPNITAA
jgi:hypothetical protein